MEQFSERFKKKIFPAGFFIHPDFPFLGASPDGLVGGESALVEVKCPYSIRNEMISPSNLSSLEQTPEGVRLKKSSNYYFQVIGQLQLVQLSRCYFIVYTHVDLFVQLIDADDDFFENSMLPKLKEFYEKHYRPFVASKL